MIRFSYFFLIFPKLGKTSWFFKWNFKKIKCVQPESALEKVLQGRHFINHKCNAVKLTVARVKNSKQYSPRCKRWEAGSAL
jgi:hypothetical protein